MLGWNSLVGGRLIPRWFQEHPLFYWLQLSSIHLMTISSYYCWQNQFLSKVKSHFKICYFDTVILQNDFCVRAASVEDKNKCIQGPPSRSYSCWMCCWQKIDNMQATCRVIIHCVYAVLFLLVFRDFDIIMHGWQYNYILLTTFLFINVRNKHDFLFCVINMHDRSFLPISNWL